MSRIYRSLMWTGVVAVGITACGDDVTITQPEPQIRSVVVAPDGATLQVGSSLQFTAAVTADPGIGTITIAWSSSNTAAATINPTSGEASGVAPGSTAIKATATAGNSTAEGAATLTVEGPPEPPGPPSVSIASITAGGAPVNITAVAGQIEVAVNLDRNSNVMDRLELLMGGEVVATQSFAAAPPAAAAAEEGAELQPEVIIFNVLTSEFDPVTGEVRFFNGPIVLSVRAFIAGQTSGPAATNSVQITLANASGFVLAYAASGASANDGNGLLWTEGNITLTAVAVIYIQGATVTTVTIDPDGICTAADGSPNFNGALNAKAGTSSSWNKASGLGNGSATYQTPAGGCTPTVNGSVLSNGQPGPSGAGAILNSPQLRHDNFAPSAGVLVLRQQSVANDCCSNNWFGEAYSFSAGHSAAGGGAAPSDVNPAAVIGAGSGIGATTYHFGAATLTLAQLVATAAVTGGADMGETTTNTANNLGARSCDRVNNCTNVAMSANAANPLTTSGHDEKAPTFEFAPASVADEAIFNILTGAPATSWVTQASDDLAGFGPNPVRATVVGNFITNTAAQCYFGIFAGGACGVQIDGFVRAVPAVDHRYYLYGAFILDQGGNKSPTIMRPVLWDGTAPTVSNIAIPPSLVGGAQTTFSAALADNLDIGMYVFSLVYVGTIFDAANPLVLGAEVEVSDFGEPLVIAHNAAATVFFIRAIEGVAAGTNAPTGGVFAPSSVKARTNDVAGNSAVQENLFAAGTVPAGASFNTRGVASFNDPADINVCNGTGACGGVPTSRTISWTATGASGTFANPFPAGVWVLWNGPNGWTQLAVLATATVTDDGVTRTWTWSWTFDGSIFPSGANNVLGLGLHSAGDGLVSFQTVITSVP